MSLTILLTRSIMPRRSHPRSLTSQNTPRVGGMRTATDLANYRLSKNLEDWKTFWRTVKNTKRDFFNLKIQEIANKKHGP